MNSITLSLGLLLASTVSAAVNTMDWTFDSPSHSNKWVGQPAASSMVITSPSSFDDVSGWAEFKFAREWNQLQTQGTASFSVSPIYGITIHAPNGNSGLHFGFQANKAECVDGMVVSNGTWYNFPCFNGASPSDFSTFTKTSFPMTVIPNKIVIDIMTSDENNEAGFVGGGIVVTYFDFYKFYMPNQQLTHATFATKAIMRECLAVAGCNDKDDHGSYGGYFGTLTSSTIVPSSTTSAVIVTPTPTPVPTGSSSSAIGSSSSSSTSTSVSSSSTYKSQPTAAPVSSKDTVGSSAASNSAISASLVICVAVAISAAL